MEHNNVKSWSKLLLFSVAIPSLLLSFSSLIIYSQNLSFFSSSYFDLLRNTTMNKNYLFLICNGLLVFLAKTSGSDVCPPPDFGLDNMSQKSIGDGPQMALETDSEVTDMASDETEEENDEARDQSAYCSAAAEVSVLATDDRDEDEDEENDGCGDTDCRLLDDEEEEEEIEKLSMEELNQKFEDFIRKMKEEMRINEARQQLVLVN